MDCAECWRSLIDQSCHLLFASQQIFGWNRLVLKKLAVAASLVVPFAGTPAAVAATPVLAPGAYTVQVITDPTSTVVKSGCFYSYLPSGVSGGEGQTTVLSYPGVGKTGGTLNTTLEYSSALGPTSVVAGVFADTYALPAVPAAGPSNWAGSYTAAYHGMASKNGTKLPVVSGTATGSATLKLSPLSTTSFTGTISFVPAGTSAACLLWVSGVLS